MSAAAEVVISPATERSAGRDDWTFHAILLAGAIGVIGLSMLLSIRDSRQVLVPFTSVPLPDICTFRRLSGIDCPGCGLTRSFISLGHGDMSRAWSYNPAGLLLYGIALFQIPYRLLQLARLARGRPELHCGRWGGGLLAVAAGLVLCQWMVKQLS